MKQRQVIVLEGFITDIMAEEILGQLEKYKHIGGSRRVDICIDSHGGNARPAFEIYYAILKAPFVTCGIVLGKADSSANLVLNACTMRLMAVGTSMKIHYPTYAVQSDCICEDGGLDHEAVLKKIAKREEIKREASLVIEKIIHSRSRGLITKQKVIELLTNETQFTPQQALKLGLIDAVVG